MATEESLKRMSDGFFFLEKKPRLMLGGFGDDDDPILAASERHFDAVCDSGLETSARVRADPTMHSAWFQFGRVAVPLEVQQHYESFMSWPASSFEKLSLDVFLQKLGEGKEFRVQSEDPRDENLIFGYQAHNYIALLEELALNEAQGHLQVVINLTPDWGNDRLGTADIKVFLKRERGDELLVLNELLKELYPDKSSLQEHLTEVEEMRKWIGSNNIESVSFSGLLKDLESTGYGEACQPCGLTVPLRPYQLQSLQFMLDAEHREGGFLSVNYQLLPDNQLLYSSSLRHLMDLKENEVRGGFLCEEMGLGKTIEILALILANPCPAEYCESALSSRGTLVVCPVSIVGQWANEVKSKLDPACNLSIYMYHGSKRIRDPKKLAKYDIVITTYATLGSDFSKATQATRHGSDFAEQFCPLLAVNWWRVVLDESHTVKDPAPLHSRACARLKANRRWCCTGTPFNTSIYDLYGQFLFLKLDPLDNKNIYKTRIGRPYERHCKNDDHTALLWTLNKIMIRHTKQQKFNGRELLQLPPKTEQDIPVSFTLEERAVYEAVYQKIIAKFEQFRSWGPTVVSKNVLQIMSLLLPLRRLCSGGFVSTEELIPLEKKVTESGEDWASPLSQPEDVGDCGICFDLMESPTKTPCGHWFCSECIMSSLGAGIRTCSTCSAPIRADTLVTRAQLSDSECTGDGNQRKGVRMESKLKALLADLNAVRAENNRAKVLIFSQFMQTITWLKSEFKKQGINYEFISGDMPMKKRSQAIEAFQKDSPTTVFLLSVRSGAVGITLTAASHVYMLEPCFNPALEEQAVGRCWRMGQEHPVVIKRLYMENSVEANILKLFRSKNITASARDYDGVRLKGSFAGCIRTDKQTLKLNEFEILFYQ